MKKLILVYNPRSSHHAMVKAEVLDMARKLAGWMVGKYEIKPTKVGDNAEMLGKLLGDGDLVIVAGGDGTASIAVNAILESEKRVTLGVLGYGNFNDMAMTFGVERPVQYGDEYLRGILEIVEKFEAGEVTRVWPLEVIADGERWRYAMCYVTCGMLAESTEIFEEKKVRERLKTGRCRLVFSWMALARWYFKNRSRKFLPVKFLKGAKETGVKLNGEKVAEGATDYIAMNSDRMARVMRGKKWYMERTGFASGVFSLRSFWNLMKLMVKSFRRTPVTETEGDVLEFAGPAEVEIQVEGEFQRLEGVKRIEVRKGERAVRVIRGGKV